MKILALHSGNLSDHSKRLGTDLWRISRPIRELKKLCPTWTIDERATLIPEGEGQEFGEAELQQALNVVKDYDIVFSTYQSNATLYTLLQIAKQRYGTQYVMDVDDDLFAVNPDNPIWLKVTDEHIYNMQCMVRDNLWITTTTESLAERFRERRPDYNKQSVVVLPNYISDDYQHSPINNGEKLVIGFFGGSSHYGDLHNTGVLEAVERIMHEHRNIHFKAVGMIVDSYLPKARLQQDGGKRGDGWLKEIYPSLNLDIALGPLEDNIFNHGKSDIKWQEATRAGSLFIASNIGPYKKLPPDASLRCHNTVSDWYRVLKRAVEDAELRRKTVTEAQRVLQDRYRLEDQAHLYKDMFETVVKARIKQSVLQSN